MAKMGRTALTMQVAAILMMAVVVAAAPAQGSPRTRWSVRAPKVAASAVMRVKVLPLLSARQSSCNTSAANRCIQAFTDGACFVDDFSNDRCCESFEELTDCVQPHLDSCPELRSAYEETEKSSVPVCNAVGCVSEAGCLGSACSTVETECEDAFFNEEQSEKCCEAQNSCVSCINGISDQCRDQLDLGDFEELEMFFNLTCSENRTCDLSMSQCIVEDADELCKGLGQAACCRLQLELVECVETNYPGCLELPNVGNELEEGRDEIKEECEPILQNATPVPTSTPSETASPDSGEPSPDSEEDSDSSSPTTSGSPIPQESREEGEEFEDEDDSVCFPADATVEMADGSTKVMRELETGDRVRVSGDLFSEVFMFTHRHPEAVSSMVRLEFSSTVLELSRTHYLPIGGRLTAAEDIAVGDELDMSNGSRDVVRAVSRAVKVGLYNPHTVEGRIAVNGVVASTLTRAVEPRLAEVLLWLPRTAYRVFGVSDMLGSFLYQHNDWVARYVPSGRTNVVV
mmetsp:Transcript_5301/g.15830  ORF Transcript_5301/g.15830 Transcript_5301/m.15830 type:complete len:516 (+) Transcript_5301:70-1617(+)